MRSGQRRPGELRNNNAGVVPDDGRLQRRLRGARRAGGVTLVDTLSDPHAHSHQLVLLKVLLIVLLLLLLLLLLLELSFRDKAASPFELRIHR